jgi:transposase
MSIQEQCWREDIPEEIARIGQTILSEDDPYRLVGNEVQDILKLEDFSHLYSEEGRGAVCPIVLSLVTLFQILENVPDREAAKLAVVRLDWKYALHVPVEWQGFHYSTLSNFRQRLLDHGEERLLFDKVLSWVSGHGLLKKQGKQRTDSTHVLGQVATLSRLEMLWETLRMALRALERMAPSWYASTVPAAFHDVYSVRQHDWQLSQEEVKRATKQAGQDGFWLLDRIDESAPKAAQELAEVVTLQKVLKQQFTRGSGSSGGQVRLRPSRRGQQKDTIVNPHEPEARWSVKRSTKWIGYKLHVTETVEAEAGCTFLTDVGISAANEHDSEAVDAIQQRLQVLEVAPNEMIVDQGYMSGGNMARSQLRGIDLFGPMPADNSGKPDGYRQEDFDIDWQKQMVTCPEGSTSSGWFDRRQADDAIGVYVRFGGQCTTCPAKSACAPGKHGRTLSINAHHALINARRAEQETASFRKRFKQRAAVEGTISALVRKHGARRARYRGRAKVALQYSLTGAAVNLKQLARANHHRRQRYESLTVDC